MAQNIAQAMFAFTIVCFFVGLGVAIRAAVKARPYEKVETFFDWILFPPLLGMGGMLGFLITYSTWWNVSQWLGH